MRKAALILAGAFALAPFASLSAEAQPSCAARVSAKGSPSLIQTLARGKARNAWSEKVRNEKRLGKPFATWKNAKDSRVDCSKEGSRHVCRASGRPCKV